MNCLLALSMAFAVMAAAQQPSPSAPWPEIERPQSTDPTSRKIIALHLKARGGESQLSAFKGLEARGELIEGKQDYRIEAIFRPPHSLFIQSIRFFRGDDYVRNIGTDGEIAWQQNKAPKLGLPGPLGGEDKVQLQLDAVLPFMFLDIENNGHVFTYLGEQKFAGNPVYVLHGWLLSGHQIEVLFDNRTFQIINYRQVYRIGSTPVIIDRTPTGLIRVDQTWWEKGYAYRLRGKTFREVIYEEILRTDDPGTEIYQEPPSHERWLRLRPGN